MRSVLQANRSLGNILVRRPDGWRNRDIALQTPNVIEAARIGLIRARLVRLPLPACQKAQADDPIYAGNECEDHARLKIAAIAWMKAEGAKDARAEVKAGPFRFDAHSDRRRWFVECGNTNAARVEVLMCAVRPTRLTIIPYQKQLWRDRSVRRLLAIDLWWPPEASDWMMRRRFPTAYRSLPPPPS